MKARSSMLGMVGFAIAGISGIPGASAQTVYVERYETYPAAVAPGVAYVDPAPIVAPVPIVRQRTVVVNRPAYVPVPALPPPVPYYADEVRYRIW
jgi:hypothetical protein